MFATLKRVSLALLVLSPMAHAAQYPWYEVEIYLFARQDQSHEHWPDNPLALKTSNTLDLITPQVASDVATLAATDCVAASSVSNANNASGSTVTPCDGLQSDHHWVYPAILPVKLQPRDSQSANLDTAVLQGADKARFGDMMAKLERQAGARPLLHMTWQQEMKPRAQAQPLHIFAGQDYAVRFQDNGLPRTLPSANGAAVSQYSTLTNSTPAVATMTPEKPAPVWQLDGLLTIYLSHYLYVETRFNLREPGQKSVAIEDQPATMMPFLFSIPMEQNRRIRSNELHYFDHPAMGMLLQVRRMQQPGSDSQQAIEAEKQEAEEEVQPDNPPSGN